MNQQVIEWSFEDDFSKNDKTLSFDNILNQIVPNEPELIPNQITKSNNSNNNTYSLRYPIAPLDINDCSDEELNEKMKARLAETLDLFHMLEKMYKY